MGRRVCNSSACLPLSHYGDDDDNVHQDIGQFAVEPPLAPTTSVPQKRTEPMTAPPTSQGFLGRLGFTTSSAATEALPPPIASSDDERVKKCNLKNQAQPASERPPTSAPTTAASKSFLGFGRLSISSSRAASEALLDDDEEFVRDNEKVKVNEHLKKDMQTPKLSVEDKLVMDKVDAIINDEAYQGLDKQEKIRHLLQAMLSDESRTEIAKQAFYKMERLQENAYIASLVHDTEQDFSKNINKNDVNDDDGVSADCCTTSVCPSPAAKCRANFFFLDTILAVCGVA